MPKIDPRSEGKHGEELINFKYKFLTKQYGVPSDIAKKYRKRKWDDIEYIVKHPEQWGQISVPDYYKTSKTIARQTGKEPAPKKTKKKPAKAKKRKAKNKTPKGYKKAPEGYYYRFYKKSGKYGLVKYPEQKQPEPDSNCYPRIMIFYEQVVEEDGESVQSHLRKMQQRSVKYLRAEINGAKYGDGWMHQNGRFIGRTRLEIAENPEEMERNLNKYYGWDVLYNDCPQPQKLLAVIATIGKYVYEPEKKEDTVETLLSTVQVLDPEAGTELNNLIG